MKKTHTKNHAENKDGEAGNSKGTKGGGSAEPQGVTRREGVSVLATRTRNKPGPRSSKKFQELPSLDSEWSDTEVEDREGEVPYTDSDSDESSTSSVDQITGKRKRRGRPSTTGEGYKRKKKEQVKREIRLLKAEKKALEEVANPKVAPRSATPEKETIRRMESLSQEEMAAEMLENINVVVKVAERSKNLKRTYVKDLKASSATLRAAATVVATKPAGPNSAASEEIERWKERVRSLEDQVEKLTTLLQEERAARIAAEKKAERETATVEEVTMAEEMPEMPEAARETRDMRQGASLSSQARARAQDQGMPAKPAKQRKPKAQGRIQEAAKRERLVTAERSEGTVHRPMLRGQRKVLEDPPEEDAMEGIRRVMEGVSIKEVVCGDSDKVKRNLENLITRCQGALSRISKGKEERGKRLPVVTSVEEVKDKVRLRARETAARIVRNSKETKPKEEKKPSKEDKRAPALAKPTTSWAEVVRKGRKKQESKEQNPVAKSGKPATTATINGAEKKGQKEQPKRRSPKTAAVAISFPEGQAAEGMRFLRSQIKLEDLGIDKVKSRKALNGATLLEISGGAEAKVKADALATTIKTVGEGKGVKVTRPEKRAEIRLKDLDESVSEEEIRAAVTKAGGGLPDDVKVGPIRRTPGGMGTCWIQCGLEVARRTAEARRIRLGWVSCRVELLDPRPLVCFRCLERGHIRAQCRSSTDRSMLCYRCGKEGHKAQGCTETPDCAVCKGRGLPSNHKAGGAACRLPSKNERKRAARKSREEGREKGQTAGQSRQQEEPMETEPAAQGTHPNESNSQEEAGKASPSRR
ncbi:PREDICTED: neurofilament medium polypeptide-like [Vollenhovia emeryi]|uniref:neurofilament medium polypeptide-like n=1 Tax=Vollenhovia emeryi TaxID=411798 RepID=UPI0005F4DCD9|nr:PREDICTED: neurofilament medium polypeptide-like [Vollenhovia emeryi]